LTKIAPTLDLCDFTDKPIPAVQKEKEERATQQFLFSQSKYKTIATGETCGGLGNQMYRYASLLGIGEVLGRVPVYIQSDECAHSLKEEIKWVFPHFYSRIHFVALQLCNVIIISQTVTDLEEQH